MRASGGWGNHQEGMGLGHGEWSRRGRESELRELLFSSEPALRDRELGPCATFRPAHPDGLRPPSQMRFVFRQERRMQVAWAFPSPNEQVALHA